jgi:predicted PurR-regulated permease PerM
MADNKFRYDLLTIVVLFLVLSAVFVVYFPLAAAIILGLTVAIVLQPLNQRLKERLSPARSAALITVGVAVLAGLIFVFIANLLLAGSGAILSMLLAINRWLVSLGAYTVISGEQVSNLLSTIIGLVIAGVQSVLASIPAILFGAFILFLSVYLFLLNGQSLYRQIIDALPGSLPDSVGKISSVVVNTMYAIYIVSVEVAILGFALGLPIFYLLGYPAFLQLSILAGLSMFIPIVGSLVVMLFLILYNISIGNPTGVLIALIIIYPVVLWIPGSLVRSRLMGKRIGIHPVIMMIGIIGGISIMGMIGLILGPLFIALLISSYLILIEQLTRIKNAAEEPTPE